MNTVELSVLDLLTNGQKYIGHVVQIRGILAVINDHPFLSARESDDDERIAIQDPRLLRRLLDNVPCYVGGEYLYRDSAKVECCVFLSDNNEIVAVNIGHVWIERDEECFQF